MNVLFTSTLFFLVSFQMAPSTAIAVAQTVPAGATEIVPKLKANYIDNDKVRLVVRELITDPPGHR
jgi:hypothetical protein